MAHQTDVRSGGTTPTGRTAEGPGGVSEPSLGELLKELGQESTTLVRQEIALAKAEMRENAKTYARAGMMLAAGGGILLVAALVLTAFLVAGLGALLGDRYWLSALIVGLLYAAVGGAAMARGKRVLEEEELKPERTIESLQEDKRWAQAEVQDAKRELTS